MVIVHLAASPFFGGPERQMLGLALSLPPGHRSVFLSFAERGLCRPFLEQVARHGFTAIELKHNMPRLAEAVREVAGQLLRLRAGVLCCHGYKCNLVGWTAARLTGVPVVAVSRGWTAATARVRCYELLDRLWLRWMDRVVCVSDGQAAKVRRTRVQPDCVLVIRNAISTRRFDHPDPAYHRRLRDLFPTRPGMIVLAAGRLSPEKGFDRLVEAARQVVALEPSVGFALFGEGPLRPALERQIRACDLGGRFVLAGFQTDVDRFLPHADLVVLPSLTEGLPNVALEAAAAAVPVVATAVGGTPEVVQDGVTGYLVPPDDPPALADRILDCVRLRAERKAMGVRGRRWVEDHFTFEAQSLCYQKLFADLARHHASHLAIPDGPPLVATGKLR